MSSTFTPQFALDSTVFHVSDNSGVREGLVKKIVLTKNSTAQTIQYHVQLHITTIDSSLIALEADLFSTADTALAEYKDRKGWT